MTAHRIVACFAVLALLAVPAFAGTNSTPKPSTPVADAFTPVVVRPLGSPPSAVPGTDGLYHVVYELELNNTKTAPATLQRIDILDADKPTHVIASYTGKKLLDNLRTLEPVPADNAVIPVNEGRLFYVQLTFPNAAAVPQALVHRLSLLGAAHPGPNIPATPMQYTVARVAINHAPLPVLEPPLRGDGWVAVNGCCNSSIVHRGSLVSVNGRLYDAQRFAIDWMRVNKDGALIHGDPTVASNWVDYGAKVYAVADGTVVETLDNLSNQAPGTLPNPATITLRTVGGNHVILDIGHGLYAFYAHMQKGSIRVHTGEHIKAGTVIGLVGNTGNTSGPHLHFHLMDGTSMLGSQGVPYVINGFTLAGQINVQAFNKATALTGHWAKPLPKPVAEKDRFPLNLNVVDFPAK